MLCFRFCKHFKILFFFRLLVGAPEADSGQPGVVKGGAVFKCPPEAPGSCDLIQFDTKVSIIIQALDHNLRFSNIYRICWGQPDVIMGGASKITSCILIHMKNDYASKWGEDPKRMYNVLLLFCHVKFLPVVVLETPSKSFLRGKQTFPLCTPKHQLTINANLIQSISIFTGKYSSSYGTAIWQEIRSVVRVPRPIIGRKRRSSGKKPKKY